MLFDVKQDSLVFIVVLFNSVIMAYRSQTERGQKAEHRLLADPYDTESWNVLLREAQVSDRYATHLA